MNDVVQKAAEIPPWFVAALVATILALVSAITYLYLAGAKRERVHAKQLESARSDSAVERMTWQIEREKLRGDYEIKHRQLAENFAQEVRDDRDASRDHEDSARREFAEILEQASASAEKQSAATVAVLEKFYDRFVGPRPRY